LETIVLKALEKNPNERYATAQALADDLRRFLEDRPIRAKRASLTQRLRKLARRHRPVVVTGAVSGVLLLVLAVVALAVSNVWIRRETDQKDEAIQQKETALTEKEKALTAKNTALKKAKTQEKRARDNAAEAKKESKRAERQRQLAEHNKTL